jgi:choline kinase
LEDALVPAVILAAGLGRRIAALANGRPKSLLELHGRSLLDRQLHALAAAGFDDVIVVTGHAAPAMRDAIAATRAAVRVRECWNADHATANNIVSVLRVRELVEGGFCLLNSDITFDPTILLDVAALEGGNGLVVDGDEPLGDEEMKVILDTRGVLERISKGLDPAASAGEYIGICRFDAAGAARLMSAAAALVDAGQTGLYYEDAIDRAAGALDMRPIWTRGRAWTEIDDEVDFARAVRVAAAIDAGPA